MIYYTIYYMIFLYVSKTFISNRVFSMMMQNSLFFVGYL